MLFITCTDAGETFPAPVQMLGKCFTYFCRCTEEFPALVQMHVILFSHVQMQRKRRPPAPPPPRCRDAEEKFPLPCTDGSEFVALLQMRVKLFPLLYICLGNSSRLIPFKYPMYIYAKGKNYISIFILSWSLQETWQ